MSTRPTVHNKPVRKRRLAVHDIERLLPEKTVPAGHLAGDRRQGQPLNATRSNTPECGSIRAPKWCTRRRVVAGSRRTTPTSRFVDNARSVRLALVINETEVSSCRRCPSSATGPRRSGRRLSGAGWRRRADPRRGGAAPAERRPDPDTRHHRPHRQSRRGRTPPVTSSASQRPPTPPRPPWPAARHSVRSDPLRGCAHRQEVVVSRVAGRAETRSSACRQGVDYVRRYSWSPKSATTRRLPPSA